MDYQPRLKKIYEETVRPELVKELEMRNPMAAPLLTKIIVNVGLGEAKNDTSILDSMEQDIALVTGQKPVRTQAKKAISNFKIRAGQEIGLKVTLRGNRMWEFYDKLVNIVLPRVKDFRGVSAKAFDGKGNYSLVLKEHTIFPEIDTNKVTRPRSIQIILVSKNADDDQAKLMHTKLGMPFVKK